MTSDVLRVGVVGAGFMTQVAHLPTLALVRDVEVIAIADVDADAVRRVGARHGIERTYLSCEDLVADEASLDAVVVATPRMHHAEACLPAIERGLPVFLEKPLEASVGAGQQIVDAQRRAGGVLVVGYHNRFDPAFVEAERILAEEELGQVRYARIHSFGGAWKAGAVLPGGLITGAETDAPAGPPGAESRDGKTFPPQVEWIEGWIHEVNMARALLGEATGVRFATNDMPRLALVDFERAPGLFEVGLVHPPGTAFDCRIDVQCTGGSVVITFAPPLAFRERSTVTISTPAGSTTPSLAYTESFVAELIHFLRCVRGEEAPLTTAADALRDLELCFGIIEAGRGGPVS